jgi:hydroxymethylglutaryl-CoA lyase
VRIREVGPRDGFQNEPEVIATDEKVRLIDMLSATGLGRLEVTSFVRPDVIPQLADAEQVLERIARREEVAFSVLIPNERGLARALGMRDRFDEVNLFLSASETHNRRNVNRSIEESLAGLERTIAAARGEGLRCEGVPTRVRFRPSGSSGSPSGWRRRAARRSRSGTRPGWPIRGRCGSSSPPRAKCSGTSS